ncbi:MAG: hypothetical protein WDZ62_00010 [Candidatus Pacearchaeota archaeon]
MNLQFYLERLKDSEEFKKFIKENSKSFLCSGFFTIDFQGKDNQRHIDFYIPKKKEVVSFEIGSLDGEVKKIPAQGKFGTNIQQEFLEPKEIREDINFDLEDIEDLIKDEIEKHKVKGDLQKIMVSLQDVKGRPLLVCTIFVSMFGLLKVNIDPKDKKVLLFEKKSFFDFVKKVK